MQYSVTFIHKLNKKEFIISNRTKSHILKLLIKKAFHFQNDIKYLRHINARVPIQVHQIFNFPNQNQFQIILEDESDQKSKSQNYSQKNMSKLSGRKHPPSQRQLLDSKFYIDDFQLFMSEIDDSKANRYFGIIFFSNRKKAMFLGKKILRQLIFQFDQIQFFYALHPIKMHNTSALLGQVLVFSLFKGKKMVHQRQFPQQITAAEQIVSYLKNLMKVGQLVFKKDKQIKKHKKRSKNLISVSQQRSFDQKNDFLPKQKQFQQKNLTQFFKIKQISPLKVNEITPMRFQSPTKSPITNQISFQTQFYQPQWFRQGDTLNRLEKSFLSALIKQNNLVLINFCQGLQLKKNQKQSLNKKLLKVFLQQIINDRLQKQFSQIQIQIIQQNKQNRKSYVFSSLLRLYKFGDIDNFVYNIKNNLEKQINQVNEQNKVKNRKASYLQLAKEIKSNKKQFTLKLMQPDQFRQPNSPIRQNIELIGQNSILNQKNQQIATEFHKKDLPRSYGSQAKNYKIIFSDDYNQADCAQIQKLIHNGDAFLIQNFIPNEFTNKKFNQMSSEIVKKYLKSIQPRYQNLHQRTTLSNLSKKKLNKLQTFMSLLYFIYKNRHINKKQLKGFFYLYIWSDLNVLSSFQLYLQDRDISQMLDTLYLIDYTYYLNGKYGIDMNQVQNFTIQIESQLIILFLLSDYIPSIQQRLSAQKFIRAGDMTLYKIYHNFSLVGQQFIQKALQICKQKQKNLEQHSKNQNKEQIKRLQRNKERCNFIQQIKPVHFKNFNKVNIVQECINLDEPKIHQIFDAYDKTNELVKWIDLFSQYIQNLQVYHMQVLLQKITKENNIDFERLQTAKPELLKGIYQSYMITQDKEDLLDSIQHILKKLDRDSRVSSPTKSP